VLIWLTGSDYNTLLTIASEMILVPYFLVGAYLLKIATRPAHYVVGVGACIYGLWLLYASGPMHLLLSVVLYRVCWCLSTPAARISWRTR
jgi:arginine:ornithine antiporter/lysine permease